MSPYRASFLGVLLILLVSRASLSAGTGDTIARAPSELAEAADLFLLDQDGASLYFFRPLATDASQSELVTIGKQGAPPRVLGGGFAHVRGFAVGPRAAVVSWARALDDDGAAASGGEVDLVPLDGRKTQVIARDLVNVRDVALRGEQVYWLIAVDGETGECAGRCGWFTQVGARPRRVGASPPGAADRLETVRRVNRLGDYANTGYCAANDGLFYAPVAGDGADLHGAIVFASQSGARKTLTARPYMPWGVQCLGDGVIWVEATQKKDELPRYWIMRVAQSGGAPSVLYEGAGKARCLIHDERSLYWIEDRPFPTSEKQRTQSRLLALPLEPAAKAGQQ